jgi:streptogramin lyase
MRRRLTLALGLVLMLAGTLALPVMARNDTQFPARIDLPDGWQPEGITAGRGTTVYVGSLANGAILEVDVRTGARDVLVPGAAGEVAVGVEYEAGRNRLWVAGGGTGEVRVYDATTGALLRTYTFSPTGFLNDLVVTRDAVYVTDSGIQELKVIPLGSGGSLPASGTTLPLTGDIQYVPNAFNVNGIVAAGRWLILVQSVTGQLFRVDPDTGVGEAIDLGGASASFGDGLELVGRTLYVVRNQLEEVAVFRLGAKLESARLIGSIVPAEEAADVPTTVAFQAGRLWAVNARFGTPPTPATDYWITRLPTRP